MARAFALALAALAATLVFAAPVEVREEPLTLADFDMAAKLDPDGKPVVDGRGRPVREIVRKPDQTYTSVVLENAFVKVIAIPELSGVVYRAIDKTSGDDFFYYEPMGKHWYVYWESGVKANFPKAEHSFVTFGQPAAYRVYRAPDGSATLAMWMEFSRWNTTTPNRKGRFSRMMLTQLVTLRPGEATFSITYRVVNPSPYRQGVRIWNDTFYPRNHTAGGAVQSFDPPPAKTDSELVYPTVYLSFHRAEHARFWDDAKEGKLGDLTGDPLRNNDRNFSYFAWDMPYGFCGMWYPQPKVNRLRIWDPKVAPGAKVYFEGEGSYNPNLKVKDNWRKGLYDVLHCNYNFVELWGGSETLFENVEQWIGAGETYEFTHHYAHVRGIGKADYADTRVAVNIEFGDKPLVEAVTLRPVDKLTILWDAKPLATLPCGPGSPARVNLPAGATQGRLTLKDGETVVLDQTFPLEMKPNPEAYERIRRTWTERDRNPEFWEMFADMPDTGASADYRHGSNYRTSIGKYPDGSTGRGRLLYRDGQLDASVTCLRKATEATPDDGEAWHLLGVALLERAKTDQDKQDASDALRKATEAKVPYPAAHYFLALQAIERKDAEAAKQALAALAKSHPGHFEGALLAAWVNADLPAARRLESQDPVDPRVVAVLAHCGAPGAQAALTALLKQEPGAKPRLDEFVAATEGRYQPPARLGR